MRSLLTLTLALPLLVACQAMPTNDPGTGINAATYQEIYLPSGDFDKPVKRYIVSPYWPDNAVEVTIRPPGEKKQGEQDIVVASADERKTETTVPCPICKRPIKVRVRRPPPPRSDGTAFDYDN